MATSTNLSSPLVTVNAVDLSDQCTAANVTLPQYTALTSTAFGDTADKYVKGLESNEWSLDLYWSTSASETMATLQSLVGTSTTITLKTASGATSATNPLYTLSNSFMAVMPVVYAVGALSTCTATFTGGNVVTTTS